MYCVKLLIDEAIGGNACFRLLPPEVMDPGSGVRGEVIQCTCLASNGGCAMIRITDPKGILKDRITDRQFIESEHGECMIDRLSRHQLIAMVMNNNCLVSRIMSESGCFITSAVLEEDGDICWTVVGPNTTYIQNLIDRLNREGFEIRKKSTSATDYTALMSERQEEALRVAMENGFYEIPRKIKMDELSKLLNCSKSTLDITLRSAEKKIVTHYMLQNKEKVINRKK